MNTMFNFMKEPRYHIFLILLKRKWWFKGVTKNIAPPPRLKLNQNQNRKLYNTFNKVTTNTHIFRAEISDKTRDSKKKDICLSQGHLYFYEWNRSFSHESCGKPWCFSSDWRCCISFHKMVSLVQFQHGSISWGTIFIDELAI